MTDLLDQAGIAGTPVGQLAKSAVTALLDDAAVAGLIGDIAADVLSGQPVEAVTDTVVRAVLTEPDVQAAVGAAVGEAVGALFGDNPIGSFVGWVAGGAATLFLGFLGGVATLFNVVPKEAAAIAVPWPVAAIA